MGNLPNEIKLTNHARQRLEERNNITITNYYNTKNLMRSSCKWYGIDDLIYNEALYRHAHYTTRKSNQMAYITDGNIEVIYNKDTKTAITVLEVKEKFKPITQYIKPETLEKVEIKKENKMKRKLLVGNCPDCGKENVEVMERGMYEGLCKSCMMRKQNAKARGRKYIPYLKLSKEEKIKLDNKILAQAKLKEEREHKKEILISPEAQKTIPVKAENYYQVMAEQNPDIAIPAPAPVSVKPPKQFDPLSDKASFIATLKEGGCDISEENLENVLNILMNTDKLKTVLSAIIKDDNKKSMLDLEQLLPVVEQKLQYNWEYNGFQELDDIKFKGFLTWRRILKENISFWKKLYETDSINKLQQIFNAEETNTIKRYQVTTESISTIFNTRRPFTRVFYAKDEEQAHKMLMDWFKDRNLHEDPKKTVITKLENEGDDSKNGK